MRVSMSCARVGRDREPMRAAALTCADPIPVPIVRLAVAIAPNRTRPGSASAGRCGGTHREWGEDGADAGAGFSAQRSRSRGWAAWDRGWAAWEQDWAGGTGPSNARGPPANRGPSVSVPKKQN